LATSRGATTIGKQLLGGTDLPIRHLLASVTNAAAAWRAATRPITWKKNRPEGEVPVSIEVLTLRDWTS
jgi:hypothetical protein